MKNIYYLIPILMASVLISWTNWKDDKKDVAFGDVPVFNSEIGSNDIRISDMGVDGNTLTDAFFPAIAYNSKDNEYLVVWEGNNESDVGEIEIYGQRIDASTGTEVGLNDFRISHAGLDGDGKSDARRPVVAYNSKDNQYLVVWEADDATSPLVDNEFEIFGQRLNASTGAKLGSQIRISEVGTDGDPNTDAARPALVYNPIQNEFLVVWEANDEFEIFGQRLNASTGAQIGRSDFRISDMGPDNNPNFRAVRAAVAHNSQNNEYLVVWDGDDNTSPLIEGEIEIFGQRLTATGAPIGSNDFRISDMGPNQDLSFAGFSSAIAYNRINNEYLVAWCGDDDSLGSNEFEIFGQRLNAQTGAEVGLNDFRISDMGPDAKPLHGAFDPDVKYDPQANQYFVVWYGSENQPNEHEIHGQKLDASTGTEVGDNDIRISDMGPDGSLLFTGLNPALAHNTQDNEYLVVWDADDDTLPLVESENEIFCQRVLGATLKTNLGRLSTTGGQQKLTIDLGPDAAGHFYLVLGSLTGTNPGFFLKNGKVVQLIRDAYFALTLRNPSGPILQGSFGTLDANGQATATFVLPPNTLLPGNIVYHVALIIEVSNIVKFKEVTNPASVIVTP